MILWNWHVLGEKNGLVRVRTLRELGGTIKVGNGRNKIQAIVLHLIKQLSSPLKALAITYFLITSLFLLVLLNLLVFKE